MRKLNNVLFAVVVGLAAFAGYRYVRSTVEADIYRQRLGELAARYNDLRDTYNEAVKRTAVTELIVEKDSICVSVRNAEGEVKRVQTPYKAGSEVFVDYLVLDGRLWIRRVFDADTPPNGGVVIDPKLIDVAWDEADVVQGKAAYRRLDEGRWVVTVTGNGALGLAKRAGATDELVPPPPVRDYPPTMQQVDADVDRVGAVDVLKRAVGR